jgi:hypothetical protein
MGFFLKKTRLFITNLGDIKMKLTTQRLKQLIKEELQAAMKEEMSDDQGKVQQAVQLILGGCKAVMNGGKVRGIKHSRDTQNDRNECVVEVDVWLYQNGFIDDLYGAVDNPFVQQVIDAIDNKTVSVDSKVFAHLYMMGDG